MNIDVEFGNGIPQNSGIFNTTIAPYLEVYYCDIINTSNGIVLDSCNKITYSSVISDNGNRVGNFKIVLESNANGDLNLCEDAIRIRLYGAQRNGVSRYVEGSKYYLFDVNLTDNNQPYNLYGIDSVNHNQVELNVQVQMRSSLLSEHIGSTIDSWKKIDSDKLLYDGELYISDHLTVYDKYHSKVFIDGDIDSQLSLQYISLSGSRRYSDFIIGDCGALYIDLHGGCNTSGEYSIFPKMSYDNTYKFRECLGSDSKRWTTYNGYYSMNIANGLKYYSYLQDGSWKNGNIHIKSDKYMYSNISSYKFVNDKDVAFQSNKDILFVTVSNSDDEWLNIVSEVKSMLEFGSRDFLSRSGNIKYTVGSTSYNGKNSVYDNMLNSIGRDNISSIDSIDEIRSFMFGSNTYSINESLYVLSSGNIYTHGDILPAIDGISDIGVYRDCYVDIISNKDGILVDLTNLNPISGNLYSVGHKDFYWRFLFSKAMYVQDSINSDTFSVDDMRSVYGINYRDTIMIDYIGILPYVNKDTKFSIGYAENYIPKMYVDTVYYRKLEGALNVDTTYWGTIDIDTSDFTIGGDYFKPVGFQRFKDIKLTYSPLSRELSLSMGITLTQGTDEFDITKPGIFAQHTGNGSHEGSKDQDGHKVILLQREELVRIITEKMGYAIVSGASINYSGGWSTPPCEYGYARVNNVDDGKSSVRDILISTKRDSGTTISEIPYFPRENENVCDYPDGQHRLTRSKGFYFKFINHTTASGTVSSLKINILVSDVDIIKI